MLDRAVSGWFLGNLVIGGLIGIVVDVISGGVYKLEPGQITANLTEVAPTSEVIDGHIYISVVLEPEDNWVKIGQLKPIPQ